MPLTVTAANVRVLPTSVVKIAQVGTGGGTAGQPAYFDTATRKWFAASNDTDVKAGKDGVGMFATTALADQYAIIVTGGQFKQGATTVKGEIYVIGDAAGEIFIPSELGAGDFVTVLAIALDTAGTWDLSFLRVSGVSR